MSKHPKIIKTCFSVVAFATSCIVFLYSALGVLQALNLGVEPNYSRDRLLTNIGVWGLFSIVSLCVIFYFVMRFYISWKRRNLEKPIREVE
jgi:hypothetical protein